MKRTSIALAVPSICSLESPYPKDTVLHCGDNMQTHSSKASPPFQGLTKHYLTKHSDWLNLGWGKTKKRENKLSPEYSLALSLVLSLLERLGNLSSRGPVASLLYSLGWEVNNDSFVAKSSGHFSVINLLDPSAAFNVDSSLRHIPWLFPSLPWSFYFCPFSWYIAWLDLEPSSHMEHYRRAFLSMPVAFLGTPKPTFLA